MIPRSGVTLLVASAAVLAGCSGFLTDTTPSPTATPAPVPTVSSPTSGPIEVPGLSAEGIEDPFELVVAHQTTLSRLSHTRRTTATERFTNGSLRRRTTAVLRVIPTDAGTRYLRTLTFEGPVEPAETIYPDATRIETYGADRAYVRVTYPNGTMAVESFRRDDVHNPQTLALVVAAFETRIAGRTPCGERACYEVRSTALETPRYLASALVVAGERNVTNGTLVAFVDERGLVHEYRVRYTVETARGAYVATRRVRLALGKTTIERPEWAETQG